MSNELGQAKGAARNNWISNVLEGLKRRFGRADVSASHPNKLRAVVYIILAIILALALFWIADKAVYYFLTRSYVDQIGDAFDLNKNLVNALVIVTFIGAVFLGSYVYSFSKQKRLIGIGGIAAFLVGHSLLLWWASRDQFFSREGVATKCYVVTRDGSVRYGERVGIDPATGRECRPVTAETLERLREYEKGKRPQLITSNEPVFFEPRTGEPVVWYYRSKSNAIEIFDLMGFHPESGDELLPIDKSTVETWKAQIKQRLARVPRRVDPKDYAFFDARNGAPRVWYWRDKNGHYEFFDSPGFHPLTGQALLIVTREVAEESRTKVEQRAPEPVDLKKYTPFDPQTGEARVWYSRDKNGQFEFFDGPGFHPRTGVKLLLFSKDVMEGWQRELREEQEKLERERRQRTEEMERERQRLAAIETAERERRESDRLRLTQAASRCDALAGNPNDPKRVGNGMPFDSLKASAQEAVASCEMAVRQSPNELRYRYQLARALHWTDKPRAFAMFQSLVQAGYPAAYDNLGWLYLTDKNNPVQAVRMFKAGIAQGDPDSMVSLAEMIDRGHLTVTNPAAEKANLLCRAAQLGHQSAVASCQSATASVQIAEQERIQQLQTQQMMLQFMGGFLNNLPRR